MSDLNKIPRFTDAVVKALPMQIAQAMRSSLKIIGQSASTKFMRPTRMAGSRSRSLPENTVGVAPDKLTWRSGRLARSLVREGDPENITTVEMDGKMMVGIIGTRVPYARIHEFGGTIPAHSLAITAKMRSFFWAMWYESGEDKWKAMALKRGAIAIPARQMRARPFLNPAIRSGSTRDSVMKIFSKQIPAFIAETGIKILKAT